MSAMKDLYLDINEDYCDSAYTTVERTVVTEGARYFLYNTTILIVVIKDREIVTGKPPCSKNSIKCLMLGKKGTGWRHRYIHKDTLVQLVDIKLA